MPSCTRTPEQSRSAAIQSVSRRADTLAVLLAALEFMAPTDAQNALAVCLEIANEVVESLASIGGAA